MSELLLIQDLWPGRDIAYHVLERGEDDRAPLFPNAQRAEDILTLADVLRACSITAGREEAQVFIDLYRHGVVRWEHAEKFAALQVANDPGGELIVAAEEIEADEIIVEGVIKAAHTAMFQAGELINSNMSDVTMWTNTGIAAKLDAETGKLVPAADRVDAWFDKDSKVVQVANRLGLPLYADRISLLWPEDESDMNRPRITSTHYNVILGKLGLEGEYEWPTVVSVD